MLMPAFFFFASDRCHQRKQMQLTWVNDST
jgi:hypothetical protein